jgi:hypothetical protein
MHIIWDRGRVDVQFKLKAILDLWDKELAAGLTFVAFSRVKRLVDLLFRAGFGWKRINPVGKTGHADRARGDKRLYGSDPRILSWLSATSSDTSDFTAYEYGIRGTAHLRPLY